MALSSGRAPRPVAREDHLQMMGIVRAVAQLALDAPRPHFEPGTAADIKAVLEALERLRVLPGKRPDPLGMAVIRYGLQVGPAALRAQQQPPMKPYGGTGKQHGAKFLYAVMDEERQGKGDDPCRAAQA